MNKYIIMISAILNAALLMAIFGILPLLFYVSIVVNILLIWFSVRSVQRIEDISNDINNFLEDFESFAEHLEQIHSLDMFYGDENLQSLIDHSKTMVNTIIDFQEKHYEVEIIDEEDEEDDENDEGLETPPAQTSPPEEE
jgi:hypothetical protein